MNKDEFENVIAVDFSRPTNYLPKPKYLDTIDTSQPCFNESCLGTLLRITSTDEQSCRKVSYHCWWCSEVFPN